LVLQARDGKDGPTSLAAVSPILGNLMPLLPRKGALAIAAVIDIALNALGQAEDAFAAALARINVEDLTHSAAALRKSAGEG